MTTQTQVQTQRQSSEQLQTLMQAGQISGSLSFNGLMTKEDEEMSRSALSTFKAKEEEIEKKKLEVRERVQAQLGRIEEETRRLASIREVCFFSFYLSVSPIFHILYMFSSILQFFREIKLGFQKSNRNKISFLRFSYT